MKFFILLILFAIFTLVGFMVYKYFKIRYHLYFDMEFMCKYFKNNITFFKNDFDSLINSIKSKLHYSSVKIISNINDKSLYIKNEDKENVCKFFSILGKGDVDYEVNNLNYYEKFFSSLKNESKDDVKSKGILYMKLIIILGLGVVILLI